MATYYTLLTKIGQAKIANAIALGQEVAWTDMAVGDGNGNPTTPNENQTQLVREVYRAPINQLTTDPENPQYMVAELVVPTNVGGWAVNEVGIFDAQGDMVAVANFPATYKPQLEEGSGRDLVVRIIVQVSNTSVVTLRVDPAMVLASQKWVVDNFVRKVTVAGGTTGQVLAKKSNNNEDFQWVDPTAAVSVIVDAKPERQVLADGQTVVNLALLTSNALAVYVEGVRLIETVDFTVTGMTQITLARSYPAGSRIHMYQNDPTSMIADASEVQRGFIQLATADEVAAGENASKAVTPARLKSVADGKVGTDRQVSAGNGLTGGGKLDQDRSIALGTPGTITGSTRNTVTTNSHTHALSVTADDVAGFHNAVVSSMGLISFDQVGSTIMAVCAVSGEILAGSNIAGSNLIPCDVTGATGGQTNVVGTWKLCSYKPAGTNKVVIVRRGA